VRVLAGGASAPNGVSSKINQKGCDVSIRQV
jgi:hypothetical protein